VLSKIFGLAVTALIVGGMVARWRMMGGSLDSVYGWLAAACYLFIAVVAVAFALYYGFGV